MSIDVFFMVLLAALLHALWNAFLKSGHNHVVEAVVLVTGAGVAAAALLPFVPPPEHPSHPFLAASVAIHGVYFSLVALTYRAGDLSFVYPLMRGSAPLLTSVIGAAGIGEHLSRGEWLGILLLCAGILWLAGQGWTSPSRQTRALGLGLLNALVIVAYTIVDGLGVRAARNAWGYVLWMFFLNMFPLLALGFTRHARDLLAVSARGWAKGLVGGLCSVCAYGVALWAMTQAPIALVAALRETSVLFGTALGAFLLKERFGYARWFAAALITAGAVAMKAL